LPISLPTCLPRDNHRPGWATFLRHPIAYLLPDQAPHTERRHTPESMHHHQKKRLVSPASIWARHGGYGNINPLSIDYACRPRLRPRLTLGGLACPRNPWSSGGAVSHCSFATHACILTRTPSTTRSLGGFTHGHDAPLPTHTSSRPCECHDFGGVLEPRYIVGAESLDQ
jgi:hypothetical protein